MSAVREIAAGAGGTTPVPKDAANARGSRHNRCHNKTSLEAEFEPFVSVEGRRLKQKRQCQNALPLLLFLDEKKCRLQRSGINKKGKHKWKSATTFSPGGKDSSCRKDEALANIGVSVSEVLILVAEEPSAYYSSTRESTAKEKGSSLSTAPLGKIVIFEAPNARNPHPFPCWKQQAAQG